MTDTSKREELIEEAAKAMYFEDCGFAALDDDAEPFRDMARVAFAVFEQAHTPTDDERAIAVCIDMASTVYGDYDDAQGALSDIHMMLAPIAVFEQAYTPTDDEREALKRAGDAHDGPPIDEVTAMFDGWEGAPTWAEDPFYRDAAIRWHARGVVDGWSARRTAVQEPQGDEDEFAPGECTGAGDCDAPIHVHGCYRPHRSDQCDSPDEYGHIEPQGKPSGALTWADMWELPIGSIVLYDNRPFQKARQMVFESGEKWQLWEGAGSASLTQPGVDTYAKTPTILLYRAAYETKGEGR